MFIPNTRGYWQKKAAKRSIMGKEMFSAPRLLPLSIVTLKDGVMPTSVRADSSASHGAAEQMEAAAVFLVPPLFALAIGDVVRIGATLIEVTGLQRRNDIFGKLDHLQVAGDIRADI